MTFGFRVTVGIALGIYGVAFALFAVMRAAERAPASQSARVPLFPGQATVHPG